MSVLFLFTQCIAWTGLGVLLLLFLLLLLPSDTRKLTSHPRPVVSYDEALRRIQAIQAGQDPAINPACSLQFMTHGQRVKRAIVFAHGFTNCAKQFQALGEAFYKLGYNVLIPLLPHHGLADRLTTEQGRINARELAEYADMVVDIAQGLGEQVVLAGLSGGGVVTAWAAQYRDDLDLAVLISPAFSWYQIPIRLTDPAIKLLRWLPNFYQWWDSQLKEAIGPEYAYPRLSVRALFQFFYLGYLVRTAARSDPHAARAILVVTNANDTSVNNAVTSQIVELWRANGARDLRAFEFDASLKLGHDLIDPSQPDQQIDIVYPKLIELVTAQFEELAET
jgi:pimeloyl-ACP methyl ester carboxylesterase